MCVAYHVSLRAVAFETVDQRTTQSSIEARVRLALIDLRFAIVTRKT